jgi:hypothetical protein
MSSTNNKRKDFLLGESHGTASNRLRRSVLFKYVQLAGHDLCFKCNSKIESVKELSIEHKTPWQQAEDPKESFFDLGNIAFSHLICNTRSAGGKLKPYSHGSAGYNRRGCRCESCKKWKSERNRKRYPEGRLMG